MNQKPFPEKKPKEYKKNPNAERRHRDLIMEFNRLFKEEKYRYDEAVKQVAYKFYLSPKTVERLVTAK